MALEIERRFLVRGEAWREQLVWSRRLQQGYLAGSQQGLTLRVRSDGEGAAWLTLKYPAAGIARHEFEYAIPAGDADALLERSAAGLIKWRHGLNLPGGDWVLDVFEAENAPLVIAEVELEHEEQPLQLPGWCAREITGLGCFSNAALAHTPFQAWPAAERAPWLVDLGAQPA
jgi:CYTH domain-containing protein